MRIVYLAWAGSIHTRRWVEWFALRGHDVHVISCGEVDAAGTLPDTTHWRLHDLGEPRFGRIGYLAKIPRVRRLMRALKPDIVHAHFLTSYGLLALASGSSAPLVATAHGDDVLISPQRSRLMRRIVRTVLRRAQLVTVPAPHMFNPVVDLRGSSEEVLVFQYGVESRRLAARGEEIRARVEPTRGDGEQEARIVSARALTPLYRIDLVIDAAAIVAAGGQRVRLDILGEGPLRSELEARAQAAMSDAPLLDIRFHGHVDSANVERYVAVADAYVSMAESDGVSLALLEALALGAPPVLVSITANRNWVHDGVSGALVDASAESLAEGIRTTFALDAAEARTVNLHIVTERADRDTNLSSLELALDTLSGGVVWEGDASAGAA